MKVISKLKLTKKQSPQDVNIIIANDDTDTETQIQIFENDCNNISGFGLFITKSSNICNAYLNFENVSFDVFF